MEICHNFKHCSSQIPLIKSVIYLYWKNYVSGLEVKCHSHLVFYLITCATRACFATSTSSALSSVSFVTTRTWSTLCTLRSVITLYIFEAWSVITLESTPAIPSITYVTTRAWAADWASGSICTMNT